MVLEMKSSLASPYEGEFNGYFLEMKSCRQGDHDSCEGERQPTSPIDPHMTLCMCCWNDHYREDKRERHTEWRINRNWLREGDPCKVVGVTTDAVFRALLTNGQTTVEVYDRKNGKLRQVNPDDVRRVAKTQNAGAR